MAVLLFEVVDRLEVAVKVVAVVIPGIARIMYILVGPYVG